MEGLIEFLDNHNALVQSFLTAQNKQNEANVPEFKVKLYNVIGTQRYELPTPESIEGYYKDMKLINVSGHSASTSKRMSMNMYYTYQIHDQVNHYNLLPRGEKLFQQYVVTAYCVVEQNRLDYIRQSQNDIRNEYLLGLYDAIMRGDRDGNDLGTRTVLTASLIDGLGVLKIQA
ncbi:DNA helicase [Tanacetum coccineum]